jgi:hypothetical protein
MSAVTDSPYRNKVVDLRPTMQAAESVVENFKVMSAVGNSPFFVFSSRMPQRQCRTFEGTVQIALIRERSSRSPSMAPLYEETGMASLSLPTMGALEAFSRSEVWSPEDRWREPLATAT